MDPKERYVSKDFKRFARKAFADEFSNFRDAYTASFERKIYLDVNNAAHNVCVLAIGHYHRRQGGPPVWAQATTTGISYFYGKLEDSVITPIPADNVTRIYYAPPYSNLVGAQGGGARTAGWKAGHVIVETIINVLFLLAGQVDHINNSNNIDMLSNFKYVCMSSAPTPDVNITTHVNAWRLFEQSAAPAERSNKKRKRSSDDLGQRIKREETNDHETVGETSESRSESVYQPSFDSPMPFRPASTALQPSLSDQLRKYEADVAAQLKQERLSHRQEVQALELRLFEQEERIIAAEDEAAREKEERKRAEENLEILKFQVARQLSMEAPLQIECTGPADHDCGIVIKKLEETVKDQSDHIKLTEASAERRLTTIREMNKALKRSKRQVKLASQQNNRSSIAT